MNQIIKNFCGVMLICTMTGNGAMAGGSGTNASLPYAMQSPGSSIYETIYPRRSALSDREMAIIRNMNDCYSYFQRNVQRTDAIAFEVLELIADEMRQARQEGIGGKGHYASVRAADGIVFLAVHLLTKKPNDQQKDELKNLLIAINPIMNSMSCNSSACPYLNNIFKNLSIASRLLGIELSPQRKPANFRVCPSHIPMAKFRGCRSTGCSPRRSSCRNQGQLVQPRPLQGSFRNPYATRQPLRPLTSKGNPANRTLLSQSRPVQPRLPLRSFRNPNAAPLSPLTPQWNANRTLLSQSRPVQPRLPLRSFRNPNAAPLRSLAPQGKPANRTLLSQQTTRPAKPSPGIF